LAPSRADSAQKCDSGLGLVSSPAESETTRPRLRSLVFLLKIDFVLEEPASLILEELEEGLLGAGRINYS